MNWQNDGMYRGPGLGIVALTEDMTAPYIKDANDLGIMVFSSFAPTIDTLMEEIKSFNNNRNVHGIIVHHDYKGLISESGADNVVDWQKDIDGNTFIQRGLMATTYPGNMYMPMQLSSWPGSIMKVREFLSSAAALLVKRAPISSTPLVIQ